MKHVASLAFLVLISPLGFAQQSAPSSGLTGSSLDQRPSKARMATPLPQVSSLPMATSSLNFEAKTSASGGGSATTNLAKAGTIVGARNAETRESHPTLEVTVRNLSSQPSSAHFDWFFVGGDVRYGRKFIWDKGEREVPVGAASEQILTIESKSIEQTAVTTNTLTDNIQRDANGNSYLSQTLNTTKTSSGSRPAGWIVRMFVAGKLVKIQGSTPAYEQMGRDPAQLQALAQTPKPAAAPGVGSAPGRPFGVPGTPAVTGRSPF